MSETIEGQPSKILTVDEIKGVVIGLQEKLEQTSDQEVEKLLQERDAALLTITKAIGEAGFTDEEMRISPSWQAFIGSSIPDGVEPLEVNREREMAATLSPLIFQHVKPLFGSE